VHAIGRRVLRSVVAFDHERVDPVELGDGDVVVEQPQVSTDPEAVLLVEDHRGVPVGARFEDVRRRVAVQHAVPFTAHPGEHSAGSEPPDGPAPAPVGRVPGRDTRV